MSGGAVYDLERHWSAGYIVFSYILATVGSNSTLYILSQVRLLEDLKVRVALLAAAAMSISTCGIFTMHFVGMAALTYETVSPGGTVAHKMKYDIGMTMMSVILPFLFSFLAFSLVSLRPADRSDDDEDMDPGVVAVSGVVVSPKNDHASRMGTEASDAKRKREGAAEEEFQLLNRRKSEQSPYDIWYNFTAAKEGPHVRILIGSLLVAASVCVMHYCGMEAQRLDVQTQNKYNWGIIVLSAIICETAAWLAHYFAFVLPITRHLKLLTALIMGVAVCGMHYTAMYGIDYQVLESNRGVPRGSWDGIDQDTLVVVVSQFAVLWNLSVAMCISVVVERREKNLLAVAQTIAVDRERLGWYLNLYKPYLPANLYALFARSEDADPEGYDDEDEANENEMVKERKHSVLSGSIATEKSVPSGNGSVRSLATKLAQQKRKEQHQALLAVKLTRRNCALMLVKVDNYLGFIRKKAAAEVTEAHKHWLEAAAADHQWCRGVVDGFTGDECKISFGAQRLCSIPATRAAQCAARCIGKLEPVISDGQQHRSYIGIAAGKALAGNLGTATVKGQAVIGEIDEICRVMQLTARDLTLDVVVNEECAEQIKGSYETWPVDRIAMKATDKGSTAHFLGEAMKQDQEWMYNLEKDAETAGGSLAKTHRGVWASLDTGADPVSVLEQMKKCAERGDALGAGKKGPSAAAARRLEEFVHMPRGAKARYHRVYMPATTKLSVEDIMEELRRTPPSHNV